MAPMQIILAGDLIVKHPAWHSINTDTAGRAIHKAAVLGPEEQTNYCVASGSEQVIDFAISKKVTVEMVQEALPDLASDHIPVLKSTATTIERWPGRRINWKVFSAALEKKSQT